MFTLFKHVNQKKSLLLYACVATSYLVHACTIYNVYVSLSECQNGGQLLDCSVMLARIDNRWSTWIFLDLPCTFTW